MSLLDRLPPLNALRAFEAVARHLSFARAAQELSVTKPAVAQQVRALEQEIGASSNDPAADWR
jgi:LysR family glycine cleavage system transcriptional activator